MKKIVQVLMIASLGIQTLLPTMVYAADTAEQTSTSSSSTFEGATSSVEHTKVSEEAPNSEVETPTKESGTIASPNTAIDSTAEETATANDKNAPPYEEDVKNERIAAIQLEYSLQGPNQKVLAGEIAYFKNVFRITGPETIVKNARLEINLEGLKTDTVFFDSSAEALEKLSIDGVVPTYNDQATRLIYSFERMTAGKVYEVHLPIQTKNGFIKKHQVKAEAVFSVEGQELMEKFALANIIGENPVVVKKSHEAKPLKEGDDIHWKIDISAPKTTGIVYFFEAGVIRVTDVLPDNLTYVSSKTRYDGQEIVGKYNPANRTVSFEIPAPSYEEQEAAKEDENLLAKLSTIEIITNVPGKFSGTREFSNVAKVTTVVATGDELIAESNAHKVPVLGSGGTTNKNPAVAGVPTHGRPRAANTSMADSGYHFTKEPLNVYPGDSVRFWSNANFHNATSTTERIEYINNSYKPDGNKLAFEDIAIAMTRRNKINNGQSPYTAAELRELTYELRITVNDQVKNYDAYITDLIKNQGLLDDASRLVITNEMLGLVSADVISEVMFQVRNMEPISQINVYHHYTVRENAIGEIKNRMIASSGGRDGNNQRVTAYFASENLDGAHGPRILNVANTVGQKVLVDNYIEYKNIARGETVKAGPQFIRAKLETGKNQPAYEEPESFLLLPVGTSYDASREISSPEGRQVSVKIVSDNYKQSGRQLLHLNWDGNLRAASTLNSDIPVTVSENSPTILVPKIFTYAKNNQLMVTAGGIGATQLTDNQDKMSSDYPANHPRIENSNEYYVRNKNNLTIEKGIKASDDADYQMFTGGMVNQQAQYRVKISNETGKDFQNIAVLDVLPSLGDLGITDNIQRGSQFEPVLTGPIKIPASWQEAVTVSYSESKNPKRSTILYNKVTPNHGLAAPADPEGAEDAVWEENPADFSKVHSVKIELKPGYEFANGQDIEIYYDIRLPSQETIESLGLDFSQEPQNRAAWNSAAVVADGLPVVESLKVGISLNPLPGQLKAEKYVYNREGQDIDGESISVGQTIKYEIVAKNIGSPSTIVNNVQVSDKIPEGLIYKKGTLKVIYEDGREEQLADDFVQGQVLKTDSLGSLYGGQELSVTFDVEIAQKARGDKPNIATVEGTIPPIDPNDSESKVSDEDEKEVSIPIISIEKFVEDKKSNRANVGDIITYTIRVKHEEGGSWYGRISDVLSKDVRYVPNSTEIRYTSYPEASKLNDDSVWDGQQFSYNTALTEQDHELFITFDVEILESALGKKIANTAILHGPSDNPDAPDIITPPVITEVLPSAGKLNAQKGVYKSDQEINGQEVTVGDIIEYRIAVTNTEDPTTVVNNVIVKDLIPEDLLYQKGSLSVTYPDGKVETLSDESVNAQQLTTKNLGKLRGQEKLEVRFKVVVYRKAKGQKVNIASAEGTVPRKDSREPDEPLIPVEDSKEIKVPAEVMLSKTVFGKDGFQDLDETNAYVDDEIVYQLELTHIRGTGEWTGILEDSLPDYLKYVPDSTQVNSEKVADTIVWDQTMSKLTVPNVILNDRDSKILVTFRVRVTEDGLNRDIINFAQATPDDPNQPPVDDHAIVHVKPAPGSLRAEKTVYKNNIDINGQNVQVNDIIEYRIRAKNPEAAHTIVNNVVVKDTIPANIVYQSGTLKVTLPDGTEKFLSDEQINGQELVTENLGSLKGQEVLEVSFKVKVDKSASGKRVNVATIEGTRPPLDPNDPNERPLRPEKPTTDINIPSEIVATKTVNSVQKNQARVGDKLVYRIEVGHKENTGEWTGSWQGEIEDLLSEHVSYVKGSTKIDGQAIDDAQLWDNAQLKVADITLNNSKPKMIVEFEVTINESGLGKKIINVGKAISTDSDTPDIETPPVETDVLPSPGRIEATKAVFNQAGTAIDGKAVKVNDVIEYRITAKNPEAPHTIVNNVVIKDSIPADLIYEKGSLKVTLPDGKEKALTDDQVKGQEVVTENLGSLKGQESLTISFKVKISKASKGERVNVAGVTGTTPTNNPDRTTEETPLEPEKPSTQVKVPSEISVNKTVNATIKNRANVGDTLTYRIEVAHKENTGRWEGSWSGKVEDFLSEHVTYQPNSIQVDGQTVSDEEVWDGEKVVISNVKLDNDKPKLVITFKVTINESALNQTIVNVAKGISDDPNDPEVETPPVTTEVIPSPGKLEASKFVFNQANEVIDGQTISIGDVIRYQIKVKNSEASYSIVNNVVVSDEIPADLRYVAGSLKVRLPDGTEKSLSDTQVTGQKLVTENLGSLKGQEELIITFDVKVDKKARGKLVNIATVEGTTPNPETPEAPEQPINPQRPSTDVEVQELGKLTAEKLVRNGQEKDTQSNQAKIGDVLMYTLRFVHVPGTGEWTGSIYDTLPKHVSYLKGSTKINGQEYQDTIWSNNQLGIAEIVINQDQPEYVITFNVVVEKNAATQIENIAEAVGDHTPDEPILTNKVVTEIVKQPKDQPVKANKPNQPLSKQSKASNRPIAKKALPKTGTQQSNLLVLSGIVVLLGVGLIFIMKRRKDREKNDHSNTR
ncbi:TPA: isopeptide-forming domain-containing fimbrial protein [Enterococcus faecalis]|nr:isopeptide-forming domain-containing fimbrial protein [Enterococcus faecalis]HAP3007298.1 isopeptide-forming domain-containing fimbrial protein [Enterococcus faecalis]